MLVHLIAACDLFDQQLEGYTRKKLFVVRPRRGATKRAITFTAQAFSDNPMPIIPIPAIARVEDQRQSLFLIDTNNMPSFPEINPNSSVPTVAAIDIPAEASTEPRVKRKYTKKSKVVVDTVVVPVKRSKRLQSDPIPIRSEPTPTKPKRGRPKKIGPALSVE